MRLLFLILIWAVGSVSFAECTSGCNTNPSDSNPTTTPSSTYENLTDVGSGGIFYQAQEAVRQCRVSYASCVAPGPEIIDSCAPVLEACINKAQANLPR